MKKLTLVFLTFLTLLATTQAQWQEHSPSSLQDHGSSMLSGMAQDEGIQYLGDELILELDANSGAMLDLTDLSFIQKEEGTRLEILGYSNGLSIRPLVFSSSMDDDHLSLTEAGVELKKAGSNDILVLFDKSVDKIALGSSHPYVRFQVSEIMQLPEGYELRRNASPQFSHCDEIAVEFLIDRSSSMSVEDYQELSVRIEEIKNALAGMNQSFRYQFRDLSTGEQISSIIELEEHVSIQSDVLTRWNLDSEADLVIVMTDGMPNEISGKKSSLTQAFKSIFQDLNQLRTDDQYVFLESISDNQSLTELEKLVHQSQSALHLTEWLKQVKSCTDASISLSPNPTAGILNIQGDLSQIKSLRVINPAGKSVLENTSLTKPQLDLSDLPSGIYRVQLFTETETMTKSIIKID